MISDAPINVVSGLPRSGTSMMMNMLRAGGMEVVTDDLRSADLDNPRGYFEDERVKCLSSDSAWLERVRGKALKVVAQHLRALPGRYPYRVIFLERDLEEVLDSQALMIQRRTGQASAEDRTMMRSVFERHLYQTDVWLRAQPNIECQYFSFGSIIKEPLSNARRVSDFLGERLDTEAMAKVVDESLHRNRAA